MITSIVAASAASAQEVVQQREVSQALLLAEICCRESIERDLQRTLGRGHPADRAADADDERLVFAICHVCLS